MSLEFPFRVTLTSQQQLLKATSGHGQDTHMHHPHTHMCALARVHTTTRAHPPQSHSHARSHVHKRVHNHTCARTPSHTFVHTCTCTHALHTMGPGVATLRVAEGRQPGSVMASVTLVRTINLSNLSLFVNGNYYYLLCRLKEIKYSSSNCPRSFFFFYSHPRTCLSILERGEGRESNIDQIGTHCLSAVPQPGTDPRPFCLWVTPQIGQGSCLYFLSPISLNSRNYFKYQTY